MIYPKFCKDCKWGVPEDKSEWNLRCIQPKVNANDQYALSTGGSMRGTNCISEREKSFFTTLFTGTCGMAGKLYEAKT